MKFGSQEFVAIDVNAAQSNNFSQELDGELLRLCFVIFS